MAHALLPIVQGRTHEQEGAVVEDLTDSRLRHLGEQPGHIHLMIQEIAEANWSYAGLFTDDWKKQHAAKKA